MSEANELNQKNAGGVKEGEQMTAEEKKKSLLRVILTIAAILLIWLASYFLYQKK